MKSVTNNAKLHASSKHANSSILESMHSSCVTQLSFCVFCSDYRAGKLCSSYIYILDGLWIAIVQLKTAEIQLITSWKLCQEKILWAVFTHSPHLCYTKHKNKHSLLDHMTQMKTGSFLPALQISAVLLLTKLYWGQRDVIHNLMQ